MDSTKFHWHSVITGATATATFWEFCFFALLGIILSILMNTTTRDPKSVSSPVGFSFLYMCRDNAKRFLVSLISVYVCLRFTPEILTIQLTDFWAFAIGLGFDKLVGLIKQKTNFLNVAPKQ